MLCHLIADFGPHDLAFAEVAQRLKRVLPAADLVLTSVPRFSTLAAGFACAQLALNPAPAGTLVFHNVAPRRDDDAARSDNAGEPLAAARLTDGTTVVGVNAGYAFSFLQEAGAVLHRVNVEARGSQFRSRDLFPQAVAAVVLGDDDALGEALPASAVPTVPANRVAYVDGFGNLKLTVRAPLQATEGDVLRVRIGSSERSARVSGSSFAVPTGELAFAPGSSGWPLAGTASVRWMELFLRGGSASALFGDPNVGDTVEVLPRTVAL